MHKFNVNNIGIFKRCCVGVNGYLLDFKIKNKVNI